MSKHMTPEERANERFDREESFRGYYRAEGAATIFREEVEPLEAGFTPTTTK